eukprot:SAG11_NODE_11144_length_781_cov_1.104106_1_plen_25_part_10
MLADGLHGVQERARQGDAKAAKKLG